MPIKKYYGGHGKEVMQHMKDEYGDKKGEQVFYATANKRKKRPKDTKETLKHGKSPIGYGG